MNTPADELRAAADKLRELASDASEGPWWAEHPKARWGEQMDALVASSRGTVAVLSYDQNGHLNADYAAAMHPGVGTALAVLLDRQGRIAAEVQQFLGGEFQDGALAQDTHDALAVARAINGTTP